MNPARTGRRDAFGDCAGQPIKSMEQFNDVCVTVTVYSPGGTLPQTPSPWVVVAVLLLSGNPDAPKKNWSRASGRAERHADRRPGLPPWACRRPGRRHGLARTVIVPWSPGGQEENPEAP